MAVVVSWTPTVVMVDLVVALVVEEELALLEVLQLLQLKDMMAETVVPIILSVAVLEVVVPVVKALQEMQLLMEVLVASENHLL